jgi:hypothetical protein
MSNMDYETEQRVYDGTHYAAHFNIHKWMDYDRVAEGSRSHRICIDEPRDYERDRSRSPRRDRHEDSEARNRSASPNGRARGDDSRYASIHLFQLISMF